MSRFAATDHRVLMGFAEAYAAVETAWSLREAGFRVEAFARRGAKPVLKRVRNVEIHEVCPPEVDIHRTIADVRALIRAAAPPVYLPLDDEAVWISAELPAGEVRRAGPGSTAAAYALDKALQVESAQEAGLAVPPTEVVDHVAEIQPARYPVVVKPARALYEVDGGLARPTGSVCANPDELRRTVSRGWLPPVLVQPLLRGTGEGLFGHMTPRGVLGWSAHRRIRMINPQGSASCACESVEVDPALVRPAERLLAKAGWRGMFMLEFLRDTDGTPWFMELNGRAWGSMALARRRGFEYPAWAVRSALDEGFAPAPPRNPPALICRNLGMELVHLAFVARGPSSAALTDWPRLRPTIRDLTRVTRKDRLYNWRRSEPDVLVADSVKTVVDYARRAAGARR